MPTATDRLTDEDVYRLGVQIQRAILYIGPHATIADIRDRVAADYMDVAEVLHALRALKLAPSRGTLRKVTEVAQAHRIRRCMGVLTRYMGDATCPASQAS